MEESLFFKSVAKRKIQLTSPERRFFGEGGPVLPPSSFIECRPSKAEVASLSLSFNFMLMVFVFVFGLLILGLFSSNCDKAFS